MSRLCQVVVQRYAQIAQVASRFGLALCQSLQKVAGLASLQTAMWGTAPRPSGWGIGLHTGGNARLVAVEPGEEQATSDQDNVRPYSSQELTQIGPHQK